MMVDEDTLRMLDAEHQECAVDHLKFAELHIRRAHEAIYRLPSGQLGADMGSEEMPQRLVVAADICKIAYGEIEDWRV
jgi:hypothetical protein